MGMNPVSQTIGALLTGWTTYRMLTAPPVEATVSGPWRPPQWSKPQLTAITVPASASEAKPQDGDNFTLTKTVTGSTTYFFDAVLRVEHLQGLRMTEHPIQTGANVVDHAYLMPAVVTLEIGMSDVMDRYSSGIYTSDASKSVSAYQQLKKLQAARVPLTLTTRLDTYSNMLIEYIHAPDEAKTRHGLRAMVRLRQILTATVATVKVSARAQQTAETNIGPVACHKPTQQVVNNHKVTPKTAVKLAPSHVPGAGTYSSKPFQDINPNGMGSGSIW